MRETVRGSRIADFFMREAFFNSVLQVYREKYDALLFTEFFWTIRSMLLPLFFIAAMDLPQADLYHNVSTGYAGIGREHRLPELRQAFCADGTQYLYP